MTQVLYRVTQGAPSPTRQAIDESATEVLKDAPDVLWFRVQAT